MSGRIRKRIMRKGLGVQLRRDQISESLFEVIYRKAVISNTFIPKVGLSKNYSGMLLIRRG